MKMRNRNEAPAAILANVEVFDYLKEKVGERKTRTEATAICWINRWQVSSPRF